VNEFRVVWKLEGGSHLKREFLSHEEAVAYLLVLHDDAPLDYAYVECRTVTVSNWEKILTGSGRLSAQK
jgi:hypothetical protein